MKFNLPQFGAGDVIGLTGSYTKNAVWYSGIPDGMWGENGQVNGNGQPMYVADAFFNPLTNQWSNPTAWSIAAWAKHNFNPQWAISAEASYAELNWSGQGSGCSLAATLLSLAASRRGSRAGCRPMRRAGSSVAPSTGIRSSTSTSSSS